jgi:hypothetical protein
VNLPVLVLERYERLLKETAHAQEIPCSLRPIWTKRNRNRQHVAKNLDPY